MSNTKHMFFASEELAWVALRGGISSEKEFIEMLENVIYFHQLEINSTDYDLVYSNCILHYSDITKHQKLSRAKFISE